MPSQYRRNPLINVVCQLRFPPILAINAKPPVAFQEALRLKYPLFSVSAEQQVSVNLEHEPNGSLSVQRVDHTDTMNNYRFASEDNVWVVNLTSTFLAVSTTGYSSWSDFRGRVKEATETLRLVYAPAFFERVGLRYINAVRRTMFELSSDTPWDKLFSPSALGFLSSDVIRDKISGYSSTTEVKHDNGILARITTALGQVTETEQTKQSSTEISFIVDTDSFFGKTNTDDAIPALDVLHQMADHTFQSIITDELRVAMQPIQS